MGGMEWVPLVGAVVVSTIVSGTLSFFMLRHARARSLED